MCLRVFHGTLEPLAPPAPCPSSRPRNLCQMLPPIALDHSDHPRPQGRIRWQLATCSVHTGGAARRGSHGRGGVRRSVVCFGSRAAQEWAVAARGRRLPLSVSLSLPVCCVGPSGRSVGHDGNAKQAAGGGGRTTDGRTTEHGRPEAARSRWPGLRSSECRGAHGPDAASPIGSQLASSRRGRLCSCSPS